MPRDWDAPAYERVSSPQEAWGRTVLDRLDLRGYETVLDAGCGTGRVTAVLAERLPHGRVIAVDGSPAMIAALQERLPHVDARVADLAELHLDEPVDAILSTATFHWILDHDLLFERLFEAVRPGGRLVAQCGGEGNIATVRAALDEVTRGTALDGWSPWNFAGPQEADARLSEAGFTDVRCWLHDEPVDVEDARTYFATVMLGSHLDRLPEAERIPFVDAVLARLPEPIVADYVRLNIEARRPA